MLTYQLHTRIFQIEEGGPFIFPGKVTLEVQYGPATSFGSDDAPSRTLVRAREASVVINANTGRWLAQSRPPLERLNAVIESPSSNVFLHGNKMTYEFECTAIEELEGTISVLKWLLPPLLNLAFPDPPTVEYVRGQLGTTKFRWEHKPEEWQVHIRTVTSGGLEEQFIKAYETLPLFNGTQNRRLAAALSYFHAAVRLSVSGDSPWEFMSETILNYAKCLDILFTTSEKSMNDVRSGLKRLGYTNEEIEGDFIPILILRSWVDVAHPGVKFHKSRDLRILYRYMVLAEDRLRQLLLRVIEQLKSGNDVVASCPDLFQDPHEESYMNRLVAQMESRLIIPFTNIRL
jgi:hypothetical protein